VRGQANGPEGQPGNGTAGDNRRAALADGAGQRYRRGP
jgi:hypothetical protein